MSSTPSEREVGGIVAPETFRRYLSAGPEGVRWGPTTTGLGLTVLTGIIIERDLWKYYRAFRAETANWPTHLSITTTPSPIPESHKQIVIDDVLPDPTETFKLLLEQEQAMKCGHHLEDEFIFDIYAAKKAKMIEVVSEYVVPLLKDTPEANLVVLDHPTSFGTERLPQDLKDEIKEAGFIVANDKLSSGFVSGSRKRMVRQPVLLVRDGDPNYYENEAAFNKVFPPHLDFSFAHTFLVRKLSKPRVR